MKLKRKSILAGLISAAIVLPAATNVSFANGNTDENGQEANGNTDENIQEVEVNNEVSLPETTVDNNDNSQEVNINNENAQVIAADYRSITGNGVNFRKGPGTNYSSITKFNKGTKVEFLGTEGSWIKLKYNGTEGYVHSDYVSGTSSSDNNTGSTDNTVKSTKVVTGSSVNFRKGPGTGHGIITSLKKGTQVGYISESNGWAKVSYNGTVGYMSANYLGNVDTNPTPDPNPGEDNTIKSTKQVTGNSVNFRKGPGTNHGVIKALGKGTQVGYISESNGWAKISYNGTIGYMSANYLGNVDTNPTPDPNPGEDNTIKSTKQVTGNSVNFRKGPGTNHGVIRSLSKGTQVGYISESNGWAKISHNGTIGYMSANYLGEVSTNPDDNNGGNPSIPNGSKADAVIEYAKKQLGKPYVWGAEGPDSFDCSGYTQYVFRNSVGISIPRVSRDQSKYGQSVSRSNLQKGDLIFFDTDKDGSVNHVGIYMGNNQFIHASSGSSTRKVVISEINSFYSSAYVNARRVL
ncbi:MAG: SH3 domain-containing protein [Paraclostridium sp.]